MQESVFDIFREKLKILIELLNNFILGYKRTPFENGQQHFEKRACQRQDLENYFFLAFFNFSSKSCLILALNFLISSSSAFFFFS